MRPWAAFRELPPSAHTATLRIVRLLAIGSSLGCDIIAKGHGGTLAFTSQPGQGTEFIIAPPA